MIDSCTRQVTLAIDSSFAAASAVRHRLAEELADSPLTERLADIQLAASEVVSNALMHGRAPIETRILIAPDSVRVEVTDASPLTPMVTLLGPTALTGRGLLLVAGVTDRWGADLAGAGKTVWFEVGSGRGDDGQRSAEIDSLLASWGVDLAEDPADEWVEVVLADLDTAAFADAETDVDDLMRELTLLCQAPGRLSPDQLRAVRRALSAAESFKVVRCALRKQTALAVARRHPRLTVLLQLVRGDAEVAGEFAAALDEAERLCRNADLLVGEPAPELTRVRNDYLGRIVAQLRG